MGQLIWILLTLGSGLLLLVAPATHQSQAASHGSKLPTLTPTMTYLANRTKLPTLTPTPVDIPLNWVKEWPVEVRSVPIQGTPQPQLSAVLPGEDVIPAAVSQQYLPVVTPTPPAAALAPSSPLISLPINGQIIQSFGCSALETGVSGPGCPAEKPWFHDGIDIAAKSGSPVPAMMAGTVIFAGEDTTGIKCGDQYYYGLAVVVDSGTGWQTLYAHLSKISVTTGQKVAPATLIGTVGSSGCTNAPQLHFGLRHNNDLVDPVSISAAR